jgi:ubiquinone/menaquinone biosynthesis C-methylase UbiE
MSSKVDVVREHDKLYLLEQRKHQPKEYFKFIVNKAKEHLEKCEKLAMLDIGCATGDFLYYLKSHFPESELTGMDVMPSLLERARTEVENCHFLQANICEATSLPKTQYQAVFMNGVHSIFDSLEPWLDNALNLVNKDNGKLYLFGIFNPFDIDVLLQVRSVEDNKNSLWQSGWNCFSMKTFEKHLKNANVKSYTFHDFNIEIDIAKHKDDPLRSWTFDYNDDSKGVINGAMILHKFMLLEVSL